MKIKLIVVGSQKEKWMRDLSGRIMGQINDMKTFELQFIEVQEDSIPEGYSPGQASKVKDAEALRILDKIEPREVIVSLEIDGSKNTPLNTANLIKKLRDAENTGIVFVVGGSLGLSDMIAKKSKYKISFSDMTFPHQLAKIIFLEHLYESMRSIKC